MIRMTNRWMLPIIVAMALIPVATGGCSRSPATGRLQLVLISTAKEIALGVEAAPEMEKLSGGLVNDSTLQAYVAAVGERVAATAEREMPYEFHLVASDTPNAFALPGGRIYVTAGLMLGMSNERQLAAVLGHEIGHVADRHNVMQLQRSMGATVLADLASVAIGGTAGSAAKVGVKVAAGMGNLKYGRDDEYQSDELGIRYISKAGYNPYGVPELLAVLMDAAGGEPSTWTEMFRTHPLTRHRIERAEQTVRRNHPMASPAKPDPNAAKFLRMRRRLRATIEPSAKE